MMKSVPHTKKAQRKVGIVLGEYKKRRLHSSSGQLVTKPSQALAIAMSEARRHG